MALRLILSLAVLMIVGTCARDELRAPRYNPTECPLCVTDAGACTYCDATKKCSFCEGTGKRVISVPELPRSGINQNAYEESCPFCDGSGICRHCEGTGFCWSCEGSGHIDSWDFLRAPESQDEAAVNDHKGENHR